MKSAIYLRLSRDDGTDSESNSIINQREMLMRYAADHGLGAVEEYVDDGVSGTTFDRPGFQRLLDAIERRYVNTVLCKDLSRLGRNNALVSFYTEIYFPEKQVRFIAVNDGIDSQNGDDMVMPFRSVINEYYARDVSRKCRCVKRALAQKGDYQGSVAPYGYMKDSPVRLMIRPEQAAVVRDIFTKIADGWCVFQIAKDLNARGIPTPLETARQSPKPACRWAACSVRYILGNRAYIGQTVGQRFTTASFKVRKYIERPEGEWVVVPGTHEAIISDELFMKAQAYLKIPKRGGRPRLTETASQLIGLLYCDTCARRLVRRSSHGVHYYTCAGRSLPGEPCGGHYVREDYLLAVILREINYQIEHFSANNYRRDDKTAERLIESLTRHEAREAELIRIIKCIAQKNASGAIDDDLFRALLSRYQQECCNISESIASCRAELMSDPLSSARAFEDLLKWHKPSHMLFKESLNLIERIIVGKAPEGLSRRDSKVLIFVHWKHVGCLSCGV